MNRLFGKQNEVAPKGPAPSLAEATSKMDTRATALEEKIAKCDEDIRRYMQGRPPQKSLALQTMKRKKMYMQQRDQLLGTQFNVECLAGAQEQAELTVLNVEAMKAGQADLKERYAQLGGVGNIEKMMDDMADLNDEIQDINEAMSTSYAVPDGFDEADLEAEFGALEEEMKMESLAGLSKPSYLAPAAAAPAPVPAAADPAPVPASAPPA
jgi:charged multivesicular body protein 5